MWTSALFGEKSSCFSNFGFMVCPHREGKRRLSQFEHFVDHGGRGSILHDFVRTSFTDTPIIEHFSSTTAFYKH